MLKTIAIGIAVVGMIALTGCKSEVDKCVDAAFKDSGITTQKEKDESEFGFRVFCMGIMSKKND